MRKNCMQMSDSYIVNNFYGLSSTWKRRLACLWELLRIIKGTLNNLLTYLRSPKIIKG